MPMRKLAAASLALLVLSGAGHPTFAASTAGLPVQKSVSAINMFPPQPLPPYIPIVTHAPAKPLPVWYGNLRDWFSYVNTRFKKSVKYKVIDFDTKLCYNVIRVGGSCHADVEPATTADTQVMYKTLGNTWDNWRRRALIVIIDGEAIAASLYGEPHGYETIPNNGMRGQVCIHFLNSRTHGTNRVDPDHQYQIKRAAGLVK